MPHDRDAITDMTDAAALIGGYIDGMTLEQFAADPRTQDAVIRRIEILGEAAKRLSPEMRLAYPQIPWRDIAGMRDRVIHGYDTVQVTIVWETATRDMPHLYQQLQEILSDLGDLSG